MNDEKTRERKRVRKITGKILLIIYIYIHTHIHIHASTKKKE